MQKNAVNYVVINRTRSQAVAMIANCTASQQTI